MAHAQERKVLNYIGIFLQRCPQLCPCGYYGDTRHQCTCTANKIHKYRSRISGPLLDRIDIHIEVPAVKYKDLTSDTTGEGSHQMRERVVSARQVQLGRFDGLGKEGIYSNSSMRSRHIKKFCQPETAAQSLLENAVSKLGLSARAYTRILKLGRTIADLEGAQIITAAHISEAIQYRTFDRAL